MHSSLRYEQAGWFGEWERSVQLEGEAFFDVTTTPDKAQFQVQADAMTVTVLGTRFNVRNRDEVKDVVLEEGKVRMSLAPAGQTLDTLTLQPGQRALVDPNAPVAQLQAQQVNVEAYTSWREGFITLDGLPVAEVLQQIEQAYGWHIVLKDTQLNQNTMQGIIPTDDAAAIKLTFTQLFGLQWEQQGDTVYLR